MPPSFNPRLFNDPFEDPGLFIPFQFDKRALLMDLGDLSVLPARELLKISHIFISHTHMDHMVGFDRLLRLFLGREKHLHISGPRGLIRNVEGKLAGYSWNLVENYENRFSIGVSEVDSGRLTTQYYPCRTGFIPGKDPTKTSCDTVLLKEPGFSVSVATFDHQIPSLGFSVAERFHINIKKDAVRNLNLDIGPWLGTLKQALFNDDDLGSVVEVPGKTEAADIRTFRLGDLASRITRITPGQKITYIADGIYNQSNAEEMIALARDADHLFIEAAFLDRDKHIAAKKYHLTAHQAGRIAGQAGAKRYTLFHFSPRYQGEGHLFAEEAEKAYRKYLV